MAGPNFQALTEMSQVVNLPTIASGGVTTLDDIRRFGCTCLAVASLAGRCMRVASLCPKL